MLSQSTHTVYASPENPCVRCGRTKSCSLWPDGLIMCRGPAGGIEGFRSLGRATHDPAFGLFRRADDPVTAGPGTAAARPQGQERAEKEKPEKCSRRNWPLLCQKQASQLTASLREQLAGWLQLPPWAIDAIQWVGWKPRDNSGSCWTIPMQDGTGQVVGQQRRYRDGQKHDEAGSTQGIFVTTTWEERPGPVYVAEGASDTLALAALGLAALGRHHCSARTGHLAEMLSSCPGRAIVVIGDHDYDREADTMPGRDGARAAAQSLADTLKRPVSWSLPPAGHKDVRAWCQTLSTLPADPELWQAQGQRFVEGLQLHVCRPAGTADASGGLVLRTGATIADAILEWLVPEYLPQGEFVLFSGDGGEGKSFVTCHLAARLTRGEPVFGLHYVADAPCHVLIANCEDDSERTIKARMRAAEADHSRWHLIDGAKDSKGQTMGFSMLHVEQIRVELRRNPGIRLIIIDPVLAYLEGSNVNPGRDEEVRRLLQPLRSVFWESGVTCILIKHFNKGLSPSASARIADAAAWRNFCRASYQAFPHPDRALVKALVCNKLQGAAEPEGQLYRLAHAPLTVYQGFAHELPKDWSEEQRAKYRMQVSRAEWLGPTDLTDDDICRAQLQHAVEPPAETQQAADFLRNYLRSGPATSDSCASAGNISCSCNRSREWWREKVLKHELGGDTGKGRYPNAPWFFCLPGQDPPDVAPDSPA